MTVFRVDHQVVLIFSQHSIALAGEVVLAFQRSGAWGELVRRPISFHRPHTTTALTGRSRRTCVVHSSTRKIPVIEYHGRLQVSRAVEGKGPVSAYVIQGCHEGDLLVGQLACELCFRLPWCDGLEGHINV